MIVFENNPNFILMRTPIHVSRYLLFLFAILITSCQNNKAKKSAINTAEEASIKQFVKTPVILVHSAWLGSWQWKALVEKLNLDDLSIITPDLAGHGSDQTPAKEITMDNYVNALVD